MSPAATPHRDRAGVALTLAGLALGASGLWAIFASTHFFESLARDTGQLNVHFTRDVGEAYLTVGVALCWAARSRAARGPLTAVAATFLCLHALGHVYEISVGELPAAHWLEDFPGVFLPALLVAGFAWRLLRSAARPALPRAQEVLR